MSGLFDFLDESFVSSEDEEQEYEFDEAGEVLMDACAEGKLEQVKKLITKENVNSVINGSTPLIAACSGNRLNVVKYLIKAGADVLKHGKNGRHDYYPLSAACAHGTLPLVKFLLDNGADKGINKSRFGNRALHEVCWNRKDRDGEIAKLLIKYGAKVDARGSYGKTPLITACKAQTSFWARNKPLRLKQIQVLLEAGADPDACNINGDYPLTLAYGFPPIFRLLVEYGADIENFQKPPYEWYIIHHRNYTKKYVMCFEILLEFNAGVDINCRHADCQNDVLMCCYIQCRKDGPRFYVRRFEEHFIRMEVAGLHFGRENSFILQPGEFICYRRKQLLRFRDACQAELTRMSTEKVGDTGATYLDVLYQRRSALLCIDDLPLETCQRKFRIYGGLIRSRYRLGLMKLQLVDKCSGFFDLTELPRLPLPCVFKILEYLSVRELKRVVAAHGPPNESFMEGSASDSTQPGDHVGASTEVALMPPADDPIAPKRKLSNCGDTGSEDKRIRLSVGASSQSEPGSSSTSSAEPGPSSTCR